MTNAEIARRFVTAVEDAATVEALASFFTNDVEQHELPKLIKRMRNYDCYDPL